MTPAALTAATVLSAVGFAAPAEPPAEPAVVAVAPAPVPVLVAPPPVAVVVVPPAEPAVVAPTTVPYLVAVPPTTLPAPPKAPAKPIPGYSRNPWSILYNPLADFQSTKSRAEVRAELMASRQVAAAMTGEDSGSAYLARHHPTPAPMVATQPGAGE